MTSGISLIFGAADLLFFPLVAFLVWRTLRRGKLTMPQQRWLGAAMAASLAIKILLASLGTNYDVDSYRRVSSIVGHGLSVYEMTDRYNYGPLWACIVSGAGRLANPDGGMAFHLWIGALLGAVDILIAMLLAEAYSYRAAMVFLLSPVGLIVSGFNSQFDNLALLLGLSAWLLIRDGNPPPRRFFVSAACLGISLIVKHILFLFPVWMILWKPLGKFPRRALYAFIPYALFAAGFLPWWFDPASRAGIVNNVFRYNSDFGTSWIGYLYDLILPLRSVAQYQHWVALFKPVWMAAMAITGAILVHKGIRELFLLYLLILYASSPAVACQYEAIALLPAAVFFAASESWAFLGAATLADLTAQSSLGAVLYQAIPFDTIPAVSVGARALFLAPIMEGSSVVFLTASQFCALALLFRQTWRRGAAVADSWQRILWRAPLVTAAGAIPAILQKFR